jgi:catechol 2,3-dioxygenase-like lactoylglutathione lyase family enzyme
MQSASRQNRRSGVLGIHSMDHFSIAVPDLGAARKFYQTFGLTTQEDGRHLGLYTAGHPHRWGRLVEGPRKQLQYLSFGAFADDVPRFAQHLQKHGIERLKAPPGEDDTGIWFHSPQGHLFEIRAAEKSSPDEKSAFGLDTPASPLRATFSRATAPTIHPRRLSHVALYTADVGGSIQFLSSILGMRLSDRSRDLVAFMHGVHGSDHHMVALVKSPGPGFHHCSWDVGTPQDVGLGLMQMAVNGHAAGWGFGRHVLGSNYFHYVRDPWGSYCEYSAGIDYIPCGMDWPSDDWPPEDSMFLWGPFPPEDFITNFEVP